MINRSNHLANLIKTRRIKFKLSQQGLSKALGYSQKHGQFISNIEIGKCLLPPEKIRKLSEVLHMDFIQVIEAMAMDYQNNLIKEVLKDESPIIHSEAIN